jgi:hypothetical protein
MDRAATTANESRGAIALRTDIQLIGVRPALRARPSEVQGTGTVAGETPIQLLDRGAVSNQACSHWT